MKLLRQLLGFKIKSWETVIPFTHFPCVIYNDCSCYFIKTSLSRRTSVHSIKRYKKEMLLTVCHLQWPFKFSAFFSPSVILTARVGKAEVQWMETLLCASLRAWWRAHGFVIRSRCLNSVETLHVFLTTVQSRSSDMGLQFWHSFEINVNSGGDVKVLVPQNFLCSRMAMFSDRVGVFASLDEFFAV